MKRDEILHVIQKCDVCIKFTDNKKVKLSESENFGLFEKIGVDCIGPLPKSTSGKYHIILATDYASGYVEGIAVKKKTGPVVADFLLKQILTKYGCVKNIQMDSGREFLNKVVKSVGEKYNARMRFSTPYHPEANGKAERTNQSLIRKLSKLLVNKITDWEKISPCGNFLS